MARSGDRVELPGHAGNMPAGSRVARRGANPPGTIFSKVTRGVIGPYSGRARTRQEGAGPAS